MFWSRRLAEEAMPHSERAVKMAIAFVVTFSVVHFLGFQERSWPLITLCVLMMPSDNRKHVYNRACQRLIGTLIGAGFGVAALFIEKTSFLAMLPLAAVVVGIGAYYARSKFSYAATVTAITMAVVMNAAPGDIHTALARLMGISIGAGFATFFSIFL